MTREESNIIMPLEISYALDYCPRCGRWAGAISDDDDAYECKCGLRYYVVIAKGSKFKGM